jgi:hypothetical protein
LTTKKTIVSGVSPIGGTRGEINKKQQLELLQKNKNHYWQ